MRVEKWKKQAGTEHVLIILLGPMARGGQQCLFMEAGKCPPRGERVFRYVKEMEDVL